MSEQIRTPHPFETRCTSCAAPMLEQMHKDGKMPPLLTHVQ